MTDEQNKPNFWTTLPGILTGVAALLTAVGGLLVVLHPFQSSSIEKDKPREIVPVKPDAKGQPPPGDPPREPSRDTQEKQKTNAVITENDDHNVTVDANSLVWFGGTDKPKEFNLKSGESIPFDLIKVIDVLSVEDMTTSVRVTTTDGTIYNGSVDGGHTNLGTHFEGKESNGVRANVPIGIVKKVVIQH